VTLPMVVTLSSKGQLVLPRAIRTAAGLHCGSTLTVTLEADGSITARPVRGRLDSFFRSLDGVVPGEPLEVDAEILETVKGLDDAASRR